MAISLSSIKSGVSNAPPRILLYGVAGIGKTTFLSLAPDPITIQTEDGEGVIDTPRFPLARSYGDVMDALGVLATENHAYKTVCIDSLDWFEPMIWAQTVAMNPKTNKAGGTAAEIEDYGYGKGFAMALDQWREYIDAINYLRNERNMMVIQTAHSKITKFEPPDSDAYDKYELKLQHSPKTSASLLLQEHSDIVMFANYKVGITKEKKGMNDTRSRAIGSGQRTLYTQERPAYSAKNRYNLPESIPFDKDGNYWGVLAEHIPYLQSYIDHLVQSASAQLEVAQQQQTEGA